MRCICFLSGTRIGRERAGEPWLTAVLLLLCGLVLDHIPMLDQNAIFDANDVRRNPVHREAEVRKSSVHDDEIPFTYNRSGFIFESRRKALDEIEQALTTGSNVRAVLDVVRGPKPLGSRVVTLVEQRIERFQDKRFVFRLNCMIHCYGSLLLKL